MYFIYVSDRSRTNLWYYDLTRTITEYVRGERGRSTMKTAKGSIIQQKRHIFAILVVTTVIVMLNHHHRHEGKKKKKEFVL